MLTRHCGPAKIRRLVGTSSIEHRSNRPTSTVQPRPRDEPSPIVSGPCQKTRRSGSQTPYFALTPRPRPHCEPSCRPFKDLGAARREGSLPQRTACRPIRSSGTVPGGPSYATPVATTTSWWPGGWFSASRGRASCTPLTTSSASWRPWSHADVPIATAAGRSAPRKARPRLVRYVLLTRQRFMKPRTPSAIIWTAMALRTSPAMRVRRVMPASLRTRRMTSANRRVRNTPSIAVSSATATTT